MNLGMLGLVALAYEESTVREMEPTMTGPSELHVGAVGAPIHSSEIVPGATAEKMVSLKPSIRTKKYFPTEGDGPRRTRERRKVSILGEKS